MAKTSPELIKATERFNQLFDEKKLKVDPFEKSIGVSQGTIKNVRIGRNLLSADCLIKIAKYWNVSADYLLCLTDEPKPLESREIAERQTTALSTELAELSQDEGFVDTAKLYKEMPKPDRRAICAYVIGLAQGILGIARVNQILGRYL